MKIIITGAAGFIGFHVSQALLDRGHDVVGIDDFNAYYDPALKLARANVLERQRAFQMHKLDIADHVSVRQVFSDVKPDVCIHLAAQAGVRHSIDNPFAYEHSNTRGHLSVLEACRHSETVSHLIYASSSSVYGDINPPPSGFSESLPVTQPVSLYAATKIACELMSSSYAKLYGLAQTGLRFFTVYGPWGRPDMAYYKFAELARQGKAIEIYGNGEMSRDCTYIDDVVSGIIGVLERPANNGENRIFNIGGDSPVALLELVNTIEVAMGQPLKKVFLEMQPGDVTHTHADCSKLRKLTGYQPSTSLQDGMEKFVDWCKAYASGEFTS